MELSGLDNIRWVVEDAMKFVKREVKRGKTYHGIVLDPPAYGIGANGERWQLEQCINEILSDVAQILDPKQHFLILNVYYNGFECLVGSKFN
jgi:23S rRNA (cytosine1962-C5)-methyltransferase